MMLPQPNFRPRKLPKLMSNLYALLLTLVKILASWSERPGGSALRTFLNLPVGVPSSLVAGTCSKYGSFEPDHTLVSSAIQPHHNAISIDQQLCGLPQLQIGCPPTP